MTTRDAKGSFLALNLSEDNNFQVDFFKTKRPNKRLWEEQETRQIKINAPSSSIFQVTEPLHGKPTNNANTHPKKVKYLTFKSDRSRKKEGRYITHKLFLSCCTSKNVIPKGLTLELNGL